MKLKNFLVSMVVASSACVTAQAATYDMLNINNAGSYWIAGRSQSGDTLGASFSDIFNISFDRSGSITTRVTPNADVSFSSRSISLNGTPASFGASNELILTLTAGTTYQLNVSGTTSNAGGPLSSGGYNVAFIGSPVAAVPEPETFAMLLAGLGLVGFATRRRERKVASQS